MAVGRYSLPVLPAVIAPIHPAPVLTEFTPSANATGATRRLNDRRRLSCWDDFQGRFEGVARECAQTPIDGSQPAFSAAGQC